VCPNRVIDFSPWLIDDLMDSLVGQEALKNCFYSVIMENAVKAIPLHAKGIYLQEFQPWEIALVHYWKKAQRNDLIAMPHSTHRYWDLRYFFAEKFFLQYAQDIFPDYIAVNGDYSFERCIENGYPKAVLKRVEALRYIHHPTTPLQRKNIDKKVLNLLICCDYQTKTSEKLFEMVDKAINAAKLKYNVKVRMHPAFPLSPKLLTQYNFEISKEEMVTALQETDWVITSNLSAIAVDGYYQGCNIAQLSNGLYFNLSPLRGVVDDLLFNSDEELKQMIFKQRQLKKSIPYFLIDSKAKKWSSILFNHKT
jgi:surface carbohydrate biosynthesis protein (TIGR04326 family)